MTKLLVVDEENHLNENVLLLHNVLKPGKKCNVFRWLHDFSKAEITFFLKNFLTPLSARIFFQKTLILAFVDFFLILAHCVYCYYLMLLIRKIRQM